MLLPLWLMNIDMKYNSEVCFENVTLVWERIFYTVETSSVILQNENQTSCYLV